MGWEQLPEVASVAPPLVASLESAVQSARRAAGSVDTPSAVWYDRRHALVLPFWRRHQGGVVAVVVAWRLPGASVAELRSGGLGHLHAIALWEAGLVAALEGARGLPVFGVDVDAAMDDPARWASSAAAFLADHGIPVADGGEERASEVLRASSDLLADQAATDEEEEAAARRMAAPLALVTGPHHRWEPPEGLAAGRWPTALLASELASHRSAREAMDAWIVTEGATDDASSAVAALDWTVDRLVEGWASGRLTDGGPPTLPE